MKDKGNIDKTISKMEENERDIIIIKLLKKQEDKKKFLPVYLNQENTKVGKTTKEKQKAGNTSFLSLKRH